MESRRVISYDSRDRGLPCYHGSQGLENDFFYALLSYDPLIHSGDTVRLKSLNIFKIIMGLIILWAVAGCTNNSPQAVGEEGTEPADENQVELALEGDNPSTNNGKGESPSEGQEPENADEPEEENDNSMGGELGQAGSGIAKFNEANAKTLTLIPPHLEGDCKAGAGSNLNNLHKDSTDEAGGIKIDNHGHTECWLYFSRNYSRPPFCVISSSHQIVTIAVNQESIRIRSLPGEEFRIGQFIPYICVLPKN